MKMMQAMITMMSKGKGGGKGQGGGNGGVKRKDKGKQQSPLSKYGKDQKVWVGGLTADVGKKELQEMFNTVAPSIFVEMLKGGKGSACVVFSTKEEAELAIACMNGTTIGSATLQCDTWERPEREGKSKGSNVVSEDVKEKNKAKEAQQKRLSQFSGEQKVWVGGLTEDVGQEVLQEFFNSIAQTKCVEIMQGRANKSACVVYSTKEEAELAVASLNGASVGSATLQCDVWARPERDEKGKYKR